MIASGYTQNNKIKYSKLFESYYISYFTYSFGLGTVAYRGDLCGRPECNTFKPVVNIGLNYKLLPHIAVGTEVNYFQLQAASHYSYDVNKVQFKSTNIDVKLYARYYIFEDNYRTANDKIALKRFNPYAQIGLAWLYFDTKSEVTNIGEYPPPPPPETMSYPASSLAIPVSVGFTYAFSRRVSITAEGLYGFSFTDNLDDFGQVRGNSNGRNDSYVMALVKLQFIPSAPANSKKKTKQIASKDLKPKTQDKSVKAKTTKTKNTKTAKEKKSKTKKTKAKTKVKRSPTKGSKKKVDRHPN